MKQLKQTVRSLRGAISKLCVAAFTVIALTGCETIALAGVAIATIDILHDRRTVGEYVDDGSIELNAKNFLLTNEEVRKVARVKPDSWNGILLLTGEIDDEQIKQEVVTYMNSIQGVRQVVDETTITGKTPLLSRGKDTWITSKVKARLFANTGLDANRVKVITTRATVYLMGIVTQEEANRATELTRAVKGVARVVKVFEYTE